VRNRAKAMDAQGTGSPSAASEPSSNCNQHKQESRALRDRSFAEPPGLVQTIQKSVYNTEIPAKSFHHFTIIHIRMMVKSVCVCMCMIPRAGHDQQCK
jgi:hypothetical protein